VSAAAERSTMDVFDRRRIAAAATAVGLSLVLWRGGIDPAAQWIFIGAAAVAAVCGRPRLRAADPIVLALGVVGVWNLVAYAADGSASLRAALVACVLAAFATVGRRTVAENRDRALTLVAALATTSAVAGLVGVALHRLPAAERIDGVWRAGGTLEYPPALAVLCVCGLAAVLALDATGGLGRPIAAGMAGVLVAALALTYDRAGIVMAAGLVVVWARRRLGRKRIAAVAGTAACLIALAAVAAAPSGPVQRLLLHDPLGGRWTLWRAAVDAVLVHPWTGYGPDGFTRIHQIAPTTGGIALAHDAVVEQAVEAGAVAALGAVALIAAGLVRAGRGLAARDPRRLAFACIALTLLVSCTYDFTWSFPPLALLAVIALAGALPERSGGERPVVGRARQERPLRDAVDHRVEPKPLGRP
jgi:O-antigen ligase